MAPLADFLLDYLPFSLPTHLTSYVPGQTPLSTTPAVVAALTTYLAVIFGLKALMKNQPAFKLTTLFQIHNVILSSGSLLLLVLMLEEILPIVWHNGPFAGICAESSWTPRMEFYYMINYYFKYLELLDTVFLALKKKPMRMTRSPDPNSWAVIVLNLAVHVVMYYYYYATAGGAKIWVSHILGNLLLAPTETHQWKKYLTSMQITQFVIDLALVYFGTYSHMSAKYFPSTLPFVGDCAGSEEAAIFGCALLTSYLGLFINFYFQTYKRPTSSAKPNGVANGKANGLGACALFPPTSLLDQPTSLLSMSERWESSPPAGEFYVSVEVYISNAAATVLSAVPKPITRKRPVGHESSSSAQVDQPRVKEKSSWLALSKGLPETPWRPATCKLSGEGERCLLNIYLDRNRLYQTVYIHLLNHTDIRQADLSLFEKKDCLSIYSVGGERWTSNHASEPIYLHFFGTEGCHTWLALLRSYAVPEIYGRRSFPADGGSYRMWRQLELTIVQGRGLGTVKPLGNGASGDSGEADVDFAVSCLVHLNGILCGRTSEKKAIGSPDWLESFTFADLPPFGSLVLLIRSDKKMLGSSTLGSVTIPLGHFRRGELVEGWFPILYSGFTVSDVQIGELRLKLLVNEEIILPKSAYSSLLQALKSRNFLDWIGDFETKLKTKNLLQQLTSLAIDQEVLFGHVQEFAAREVNAASPAQNTLFRGNTTLSRVMELCMNWYGKAFLEASVGGVIRKLCKEKVAIEVDPARRGKGSKDIERNFELLTTWCQEFLDQIYAVRAECPQELRRLFETLRILVEKRFKSELSKDSHRNMQYRSVTAFCFLRFIVPAILNPHLFGFHLGIPPPQVHRSLTLIAKVLQSLANLNLPASTSLKEEYMRGMSGFIAESTPAMIDYILVVSTTSKDVPNHQAHSTNRRDWSDIDAHLHHRSSKMRALDREAVPRLTDLLDIPRHLATIASAVIRSSTEVHAQPKSNESSNGLNEIRSQCFDVEEQALLRVSKLKARISSGRHSTPPISSSDNVRLRRWTPRPSTAPGPFNSISNPEFNSDGKSQKTFTGPGAQTDSVNSDFARANSRSISADSNSSYELPTHSIDVDATNKRVRELFNLKSILRR
ncbi:hypothetical protein H0H93_002951 [Arthromyces matolae]|nr:hypothetical protein H0H93_002951 [Arthromyces matolae]